MTTKINKIIYPAISVIFFLVVLFAFIASASFLSKTIKSAFDLDDKDVESHIVKLDMDGYYLIAQKMENSFLKAEPSKIIPETISVVATSTASTSVILIPEGNLPVPAPQAATSSVIN